MITLILLAIISGLLSYMLYWAYQRKNYWKNRNIPYNESPLLLGHFFKTVLLKESSFNAISRVYNHHNTKGSPFVGINVFYKPAILLREPELIKRVLIKDFQSFTNRYAGVDPSHDPLGGFNLFQLNNPLWKDLRVKLSPIFTSGKMKNMFNLVENVGNVLNETVANLVKTGKPIPDIRDLLVRYAIDSISIVIFATDSGCLKNPEKSEFLREAQNSFQVKYIDKVAGQLVFFLSEIMKIFNMKTFNPSFEKFFKRLFNEVMTDRMENGGNRHDLIDVLLALKKAEVGKDKPKVQEKIRKEIREALQKHGKITYDMIVIDLPYMTAVIEETLRLYPIIPYVDRVCEDKGYSLEPYSSFKIPKGMPVYIPIYNIQRDPQFFPDPEKFIPERFYSQNATTKEYLWMPFGNGPRNCMGKRFAYMQLKVAIVSLLKSFRLEFTAETPKTIELDKETILLHSDRGIPLKFVSDSI